MKKRPALLIATLLLFVFLVGCGHSGLSIEDTNGAEDFTLCVVTEEDICQSRSHLAIASITSTVGGKTKIRIGELSGV